MNISKLHFICNIYVYMIQEPRYYLINYYLSKNTTAIRGLSLLLYCICYQEVFFKPTQCQKKVSGSREVQPLTGKET